MSHSEPPKLMPKSVFVADDATYRKLLDDAKGIALVENAEALIVPFSATPQANTDLVTEVRDWLIARGQFETGTLLVKNPFEQQQYELAASAVETFSIAKYFHFANLAKLLGARELSFHEANVEQSKQQTKVAAEPKARGVSVKATVDHAASAELKSQLRQKMDFPGSEPAIEEAYAFLQKHFLNFDQQMVSLIELRSGNNPIQEYHVTINLSKESESTLKVGLALTEKLSTFGIGLSSSMSRAASESQSIDVTIDITF